MLLEMPGFTCREAARHIGINEKQIYAWIRDKRIEAEMDCTGQLRVPYGEVWRVIKERESVK